MRLIEKDELRILKAEEGFKLRNKEDVYIPAGEEEEYVPYYFTIAYIPKELTLEDCKTLYIEDLQDKIF